MTKRVLDVGNCVPDHAAIRRLVEGKFGAQVAQADGPTDAIAALRSSHFDLVLVNRKLDMDYSDGIEVIKLIKADEQLADVPVMLITNYDEHQEAAEKLGALRGFGKLQLNDPATHQRLAAVLN